MKQKVTFVDLTVADRPLPLVAGYLQAYACQDQTIAKAYEFEHYSMPIRTSEETLVKDLLGNEGNVYAFSCYVWNMGLIRRILPTLQAHRPQAQFILGGPQVMKRGAKYLPPEQENMVICNGEGEKSFYEYLLALTERQPDFTQVKGLSFYRDKTLITTDAQVRIQNLDEIPSPYLNNIFTRDYNFAIYETTRGCPYHCAFCYWGAATNDRVYQFSQERVFEEIDWIGRAGIYDLQLADANWGMLKRDIEISQHIINTAKKYGTPAFVFYSSAKNQPQKVLEIVDRFHKAGIVTGQVISLQTLSDESLAQVDRQNIRLSAYMDVQQQLRAKGIGSFTELIWPLPGETLDSFQAGIDTLCASGISTIIAYPHALLPNTPLERRRTELQLVTRQVDHGIGEIDNIVQTREVPYTAYQAGVRYYLAFYLLYNMRTLITTAAYLHQDKDVSYQALFTAFADFLLARQDSPIGQYFKQAAEDSDYYPWLGKIIHYALHEHRTHFGELLADFVTTQPWWTDKNARQLFEIDLLRQPYFYSNTPFTPSTYAFAYIQIVDTTENEYIVALPETTLALLAQFTALPNAGSLSGRPVQIEHTKKGKMPFITTRGIDPNTDHFFTWLMRIDDFFPHWTPLAEPELVLEEERVLGEI